MIAILNITKRIDTNNIKTARDRYFIDAINPNTKVDSMNKVIKKPATIASK